MITSAAAAAEMRCGSGSVICLNSQILVSSFELSEETFLTILRVSPESRRFTLMYFYPV